MKKLHVLAIVLLLLLVTTVVVQAGGGDLWVQRFVLGSGGGHVTGGQYSMHATTGQGVVDLTTQNKWALRSGFWFWYQYKVMVPVVVRE